MTAFLKSRFPQIIAELTPAIGLAVHQGAESIAAEAKRRVHVDSGDLRDAIHTESAGIMDVSVVAGSTVSDEDEDEKNVFYGHLEEFGTTHSSPHPFLIPAAEAKFDEVVGLVNASLRTL